MTEGVQIVMALHKGTSGNAAQTDRFVWSPERDQLLTDEQVTSLSSAGTSYTIFGDQINSTRQAATYNAGTDTTTVAKNLAYDSFGNTTADSASGVVLIFGYTARYKDSDTQLQLNGPRIYLSRAGIWGQEDPIGFRGGDENLGRYVRNLPVGLIDSTGLEPADPGITKPVTGTLSDVIDVESGDIKAQFVIDASLDKTYEVPGAKGKPWQEPIYVGVLISAVDKKAGQPTENGKGERYWAAFKRRWHQDIPDPKIPKIDPVKDAATIAWTKDPGLKYVTSKGPHVDYPGVGIGAKDKFLTTGTTYAVMIVSVCKANPSLVRAKPISVLVFDVIVTYDPKVKNVVTTLIVGHNPPPDNWVELAGLKASADKW